MGSTDETSGHMVKLMEDRVGTITVEEGGKNSEGKEDDLRRKGKTTEEKGSSRTEKVLVLKRSEDFERFEEKISSKVLEAVVC